MTPPSESKRPRYGTRQLIEEIFRDPANAPGLKTSELVSKVQSASGAGSKIPGPTIFQAARALVRARVLEAKREGREFRFRLSGTQKAAADVGSTPSHSSESQADVTGPTGNLGGVSRTDEAPPPVSLPVSSLPHRLDPGQMLVLKHDEKEIVTLTNVHGRPVIERHQL